MEVEKRRKISFQDALDYWLGTKKGRVSEKRHGELKRTGAKLWSETFKELPLSEVTPERIERYLKRRKVGGITKNNGIRHFSGFFKWCIDNGLLRSTPVESVKRLTVKRRPRIKSLSDAEEADLLDACRNPYEVEVQARRNSGGRMGGGSKKANPFKMTVNPPRSFRGGPTGPEMRIQKRDDSQAHMDNRGNRVYKFAPGKIMRDTPSSSLCYLYLPPVEFLKELILLPIIISRHIMFSDSFIHGHWV